MSLPATSITLSQFERSELQRLVRASKTQRRFADRARMILLAADGQTNAGIAVTGGTRPATVSQWRLRFECKGLVGLRGDFRPGRPPLENKEGFRERLLAKNR